MSLRTKRIMASVVPAWFTVIALGTIGVIIHDAGVSRLPPGTMPSAPKAEAMDLLASRGTALLSCQELRTATVCEEFGRGSFECDTLRMSNNSQLFSSIRKINRCLYNERYKLGEESLLCQQEMGGQTEAQLREGFLDQITEAERRCSTFESDTALQQTIDEAYRRKIQRVLASNKG